MAELRAEDGIPGPDEFGRIWKGVDPSTGRVFHSMWSSDLPEGEPFVAERIERCPAFKGWVGGPGPIGQVRDRFDELLALPAAFEPTERSRLAARVRSRLSQGEAGAIDGHSALDDMRGMLSDLEGLASAAPSPGWAPPAAPKKGPGAP